MTEGEALLWVPRIAVAPIWLVSEYIIRWPLAGLTIALDKLGLQDFLAEQSDYILVPTVVVDFGFRTSIGLYAGVNNLWFKGHEVRARGAFGGIDFYKASYKDRIVFDDGRQRAGIFGDFRRRADDIFSGVGSDVVFDRDTAARYTAQKLEAGARYDFGLDTLTGFDLSTSVVNSRTEAATCPGDPTVGEQVAAGRFPLPRGFGQDFTTLHSELNAELDTRDSLDDRGAFARLQVNLGADVSLERPSELRWANYGAELGGGIELGLPYRRLQWSNSVSFADPLATEDIPFTGLVSLGGSQLMRGFPTHALRGRSAFVSTLKYTWPIWVLLDGSLHLATGNVFDAHLENFALDKLRISFGPGISTHVLDDDSILDLSVGFGTDTVEQGLAVRSARIAVGLSSGF
jgi:hypothetical protein